jgi:hypothetical protein
MIIYLLFFKFLVFQQRTKIGKNVLRKQKWRKKSEHSRKIATFADCFKRGYRIASFLAVTQNDNKKKSCVSKFPSLASTTIQQLNSQQFNNINGNQQQIQPSGS